MSEQERIAETLERIEAMLEEALEELRKPPMQTIVRDPRLDLIGPGGCQPTFYAKTPLNPPQTTGDAP